MLNKSILLVENEPAQRELVRHVLEPRGCSITEAGDGAAAIKELATGTFAAILLDLRMPHASGEMVIQWVLANRPEVKPQILVVTGDVLSPGLDAFLDRAQIPMLCKPYLLADLVSAVEKIIARAPAEPSRRSASS